MNSIVWPFSNITSIQNSKIKIRIPENTGITMWHNCMHNLPPNCFYIFFYSFFNIFLISSYPWPLFKLSFHLHVKIWMRCLRVCIFSWFINRFENGLFFVIMFFAISFVHVISQFDEAIIPFYSNKYDSLCVCMYNVRNFGFSMLWKS